MREQEFYKNARTLMAKKMFKEALHLLESLKTDEAFLLNGICHLDSGYSITNALHEFKRC